MRKLFATLIIAQLLFTVSSCKIFDPSRMLRTNADYKFSELSSEQTIAEYKIAPNDELFFMLSTNNGEKLLNPAGEGNTANTMQNNTIKYIVESDGQVNFPLLGRVKLSGLTLREAESFLEEKFKIFYNDPFVSIRVVNNRVIIFPGGEGNQAQVIKLENTNTTLFEALAQAGGINEGKANRIKLIRGGPDNPKIYLFDLSTVEGMTKGNTILQANDIIYVEPRNKIPERILSTVTPYLTLFSTIVLIFTLFNK